MSEKYISFVEAMNEYIHHDRDVFFHGKQNEIRVLFNSDMSMLYLNEMTMLTGYTFFDLTNGLWSVAD